MNFEAAKRFLSYLPPDTLLAPNPFFIVELHKNLFNGHMQNAGKLKESRNYVGLTYSRYRLFSEPAETMSDLIRLAEDSALLRDKIQALPPDDLELKVRISGVFIAHYHARFIQIHPFDDGNGRISRMIAFEQRRLLFPARDYIESDVTDRETKRFSSFSRAEYLAAMNRADQDLSHLVRCFVPNIPLSGPIEPPFPIKYKYSHRPPGAP